jgi:hypothetical protein
VNGSIKESVILSLESASSALLLQKETGLEHPQTVEWFNHRFAEVSSVKREQNISSGQRAE